MKILFTFLSLFILFSCVSVREKESDSDDLKIIGKWYYSNTYAPNLQTPVEYIMISLKKPKNYKGFILNTKFPRDQDSLRVTFSKDKDRIYEFKTDGRFSWIDLSGFELMQNGNTQRSKSPTYFNGNWKLIQQGKIELDFDEKDYLRCCVFDWDKLKSNPIQMKKRKKIQFEYDKISNDSLYIREKIYENNTKAYPYLYHIYLKKGSF